jgi:hypothetical protein
MARYGRDFGMKRSYGAYDRSYGRGGTYERGWDIGPTWGGGSDLGYRTDRIRGYGYDRDLGMGERVVYEAGGHRRRYDRDLGDQLREGWNTLKRGARRAFGGGYDRSDYGGGRGYGYRGGYAGYGRGYDRGWF